ncbi:hypothetical protein [Brevibacillus choshinensis]|uniref:hypothetical protein n=1 Tax=Brevibacillus choshinensis TaxID=54911 RepID=UPI002E20CFE5|nr:hypothetical protein [Brevibacillus choshinensis]
MFETINYGSGKVVYNDFVYDKQIPFEEQLESFKEDLFQVVYQDRYIIDVGWYPSFSKDGEFQIVIIVDFDWEFPYFKRKCRSIEELENYMLECVSIVKSKLIK